MKKHSRLHIILSVLLALLFFAAGTGYNLVYFCCSACEEAGTLAVASQPCECIHHHHHHADGEVHADHDTAPHVCDFLEHHSKSCEFQRLTVDTPTLSHGGFHFDNVGFSPLTLLFISSIPSFSFQESGNLTSFPRPPDFSVPLSGREILARHSLLLI